MVKNYLIIVDNDATAARLAALDSSIARGLADADAGRTRPAAEIFDRLTAKYQAMLENHEG